MEYGLISASELQVKRPELGKTGASALKIHSNSIFPPKGTLALPAKRRGWLTGKPECGLREVSCPASWFGEVMSVSVPKMTG